MSDPISLVRDQFIKSWNAHDARQVLAMFTDDAVVSIDPPFPGAPPTFTGTPELPGFVQAFISGIHIDDRNYRSSGKQVLFDASVGADATRHLGVPAVDQSDEVVLEGDKIKSFSIHITPESHVKLLAGAANIAAGG